MELTEQYWESRYQSKYMGWDIGFVSTPLKTYFEQLTNKDLKILIPGGGNSYEAEYLHLRGFKNVFVVDISATALSNIQERVPTFPSEHLIHSDFFYLNMTFDLIIEQTFFCALHPKYRHDYALKMSQLLNTNGKLVGVLFNIPLNDSHPPFGGNKEEYLNYFKPYFKIEILEDCYNSVKKRMDTELFFKFLKL